MHEHVKIHREACLYRDRAKKRRGRQHVNEGRRGRYVEYLSSRATYQSVTVRSLRAPQSEHLLTTMRLTPCYTESSGRECLRCAIIKECLYEQKRRILSARRAARLMI